MKKVEIFPFLILIAIVSSVSDLPAFSSISRSIETAQADNLVIGVSEAQVGVEADGTVTFGGNYSNVAKITISHDPDSAGSVWQIFDAEKFKTIGETQEVLYVRFMTDKNVVSDTVVYAPILNEGDIVKTPDNPDVYIIKYKNGKQYKRLILSPSVFDSYGHLKWENLKITISEQLDAYNTSNLVQVAGDKFVYLLAPYGDEGEKTVLDTGAAYDYDSVYEINAVDRDSYNSVASSCSGLNTQSCVIAHGIGSQLRVCRKGTWSAWGNCTAVTCNSGYEISGNACVASADTSRPDVTAFVIPATSSSLVVPVSSFSALDNVGVTGYLLTTASSAPAASATGWTASAPSSYTFDSEGSKTLYAWAKDAAGNVSASLSDSVVITLPDTVAPIISSVSSSATSTSATIHWTTDESATSVVDYGTTASYGTTTSSASRVTSHSVTLTGLAASTLYHYRISSADAASNTAASADYTFTTSAASGYITGPMQASAKAVFLHHSTGGIVWDSGVASNISSYNNSHGTSYNVTDLIFPKASPYGWNNYPYDYWNIWVNHAGSSAYLEEPTLEMLTKAYDVIIWKHCYPVSSVLADTGSPNVASSTKRLENYKLQYQALKQKMHEFPNKRFIVWTGAALVESATVPESAAWAREFANWVTGTWDEPNDNIFIWDFRQLETEGGLYLLPEHAYSASNSHPSYAFGEEVAPIFANRIIEVIEGRDE